MSRAQQLPHVRAEPAPAASKGTRRWPEPSQQANKWCCLHLSESIFKKGKRTATPQQLGECGMRSSPAAPKGSGGAPGTQQQFPCGLWRGPWWSRLSPCSPWVPHGADLHAAACGGSPGGAGGCGLQEAAAHGEPPQKQAPGRSCSPWRGAHAGAGGLGGAAAHGGPVLEQFAPGGRMDAVVRSRVGAVLEELLPVGSPCRLSSGIPWEGPHVEQGQRGDKTAFWSINHSFCFYVTTSYWPPKRCPVSDAHSLSMLVQPICKPLNGKSK